MRFVKKRGNNHYDLFAVTEIYDYSKSPGNQDDEWDPWEFPDDMYEAISDYYKRNKDKNVTVLVKGDDCESDEDMDIPAYLISD